MRDKFTTFNPAARKALSLAQEEAQRFNHNCIGTEHLLLGLEREGEGIAAGVLESLGSRSRRRGTRSCVSAASDCNANGVRRRAA